MAEKQKILRLLGYSDRYAKLRSSIDSVVEDDAKQLAGGITYSQERAWQAVVHSRQDMVALVGLLGEVGDTLGSIKRWLIIAVVVLGVLAVKLLS